MEDILNWDDSFMPGMFELNDVSFPSETEGSGFGPAVNPKIGNLIVSVAFRS
jgi:hypothetical protein